MRERARCIGCGRLSPETETNYTLISSQFGWRLTRFRREDGEFIVEWRCPSCWKTFKDARKSDDPNLSSRPPSFTSSAPPAAPPAAMPPSPRAPQMVVQPPGPLPPPRVPPLTRPPAPRMPSVPPPLPRKPSR